MAKKRKKFKYVPGLQKKTKKNLRPRGSPVPQSILQEALALHQAGRLLQAEELYRQVLRTAPNHPVALHYLGMLAQQTGKSALAVELISRAIAGKPDYVEAFINLGILLKKQGRLDEAIASFRQALTLKPDLAPLHYNLGVALNDQGKLDEAIASFRQALTLKPDFIEAHCNMGVTLKDQGRLDEAIASFRQALTLKPDLVEAHSNLGVIFKDQGRLDEAVASYRRALTLRPDYAPLHYNLGIILNDQGKLNEAIASYRQALVLKPDFIEAHCNLGFIYRELGKMDDAIACFRKALALKPDYVQAYKGLSTCVKYAEVDEVIHSMENLYNQKDLSDADRIDLGFALGKIFEDLRDYEKSFRFILAANKLKRGSYEYSIHNVYDLFERIKKIFSPDFFSSHHGIGSQERTPIFIVGMPRSGTTLVEQILASHPLVSGAGELSVLENLIDGICSTEKTAHFPECMLDLGVDAFERLAADYIAGIREHANDAAHITDKRLNNFLRVGLIKIILPHARVIHCVRNPMDNCLSIFKNDFTKIHGYAYDLVELGRYYTLYLGLMAHWEKVLPGFMHTLRYEEIVLDLQNQTKGLLDFCGLPWHEACLAFHKTERRVQTASFAQVRQPLYQDSIALWKRYEKQLAPLKKAINGESQPE